MILLITAFDLGRRARWSWLRLLLIALAGTVPFLSFVAERSATKDVRRKLAAAEPGPPPSARPDAIAQSELAEPEVPTGPSTGRRVRERA